MVIEMDGQDHISGSMTNFGSIPNFCLCNTCMQTTVSHFIEPFFCTQVGTFFGLALWI